ncbi:hypothetical protein C3F09_13075 [candidate division GN15 bacterium]|uniref:DUF3303 domain-containing protein n=1 Tax=candidate division GN15 bacterium TaxID=2072418 RepID=A0A855X2M5_9BACT|nr:MAG: hypothetical protein C3F09_13075 [candidate division GN15 bacterium]
MNYYHLWCNLKESHKDLEFCRALDDYLGYLKSRGLIQRYSLSRRKFGFGPPSLGEFHVVIEIDDLAQLDSAFGIVARRSGETEVRHREVYSAVTDLTTALYRDFPDPQRGKT